MKKHLFIILFGMISTFFAFSLWGKVLSPTKVEAFSTTWVYPLENADPLIKQEYGTVVENTGYAVKNLDLIQTSNDEHITCFGIGWHRPYHAGVDLYLPNGNTAGADVRAVSNGEVVKIEDLYGDGYAVVIKHLTSTGNIWSAYWHVDNLQVYEGQQNIQTGQVIGQVKYLDYEGRFPDIHPFSNDSHLHFEIRDNFDNPYPDPHNCNRGSKGVGYTYPELPIEKGYLDPLAFLQEHITPGPSVYSIHLPLFQKPQNPVCDPAQTNLLYNGGFEDWVATPVPWFQISTFIDPAPNLDYKYRIVEINPYEAKSGFQSALLGYQFGPTPQPYVVDEEFIQSVFIPGNTSALEWRQTIKLNRDQNATGDHFFFSLKDEFTGQEWIADEVIDDTSTYPNGTWLQFNIRYENLGVLQNHTVSLSFNAMTDGDVYLAPVRVDDVQLIPTCGNPGNGQITKQVMVTPIYPTPTPTLLPPSPTPTQTPAPTATPTKTPTPTATVPVDQYEPNNSYGQTKDFGTRSSLIVNDATISTPNDEDWFEFDVPAICVHCVMQVSLSMIPSGANYDLELYGDDPETPLASSHKLSNLSENLEFDFWDPQDWGSFRLRIYAVSGASLSPYHLQMDVVSNLALIYEPNNTFRDAYNLTNGTATNPLQAALYPATDEDWFKLYLNPTSPLPAKGHQILILQLSVPAGADYELALFNQQGVLLTTSIHSGNAPEYISFQITQAGWYYIRVYPSANAEQTITDPYTLSYQYQP